MGIDKESADFLKSDSEEPTAKRGRPIGEKLPVPKRRHIQTKKEEEDAIPTLPNFTPLTLIRKETVTEGSEFPVRRFTYELPKGKGLSFRPPRRTVKIRKPRRVTARNYSITSHPKKSEFDLTVKIYPGGTAAYLDSVKIGDKVEIAKSRHKEWTPGRTNGIIVYGVGQSEVVLPIQDLLNEDKSRKVTLVIANRYIKDFFMKQQLDELELEFPEQLKIHYLFSREEAPELVNPKWKKGRFSKEMAGELFDSWSPSESKFWVIGTRRMKNDTASYLADNGFEYHRQWSPGNLVNRLPTARKISLK